MPKWDTVELMVDTGAGLVAMETSSVSDAMGPVSIVRGLPVKFDRRVARVGHLNKYLRNTGQKYSPDHASALSGFLEGKDCRFRVQYNSVWYPLFRGNIDKIGPEAGSKGRRRTLLRAVDQMDFLQAAKVGVQVLTTNQRADQVISTLVSNAMTPVATSYDVGKSNFPYIGFRDRKKVQAAIADMCDSEGFPAAFYAQDDGTMTWENRHTRREDNTADWTLSNSMSGLTIGRSRRERFSEVLIDYHPADVGTVNEVLGAITNTPRIAPGETKTLRIRYRDPNDENVKKILGKDMVTVAVNTDIILNSESDGSGSDVSGDFTIVHTKGANSSDIALTNNGTSDGYATTAQVRGIAIRLYEDDTVFSIDASPATGVNALALDMPFNDDENLSQNLADWIQFTWGGSQSRVSDLYVRPGSDTLMKMILSAEISDRVRITEPQTGLSSDDFYINNKQVSIQQGGFAEAHFDMEKADENQGWLLGIIDRGEFGSNAIFG